MILGKEIFLAHGLRMQEPGFGKLDDSTSAIIINHVTVHGKCTVFSSKTVRLPSKLDWISSVSIGMRVEKRWLDTLLGEKCWSSIKVINFKNIFVLRSTMFSCLMVFCGKVEIAEDGSVKGIADAPHYKPMEIQGNLQEIAQAIETIVEKHAEERWTWRRKKRM